MDHEERLKHAAHRISKEVEVLSELKRELGPGLKQDYVHDAMVSLNKAYTQLDLAIKALN